MKAPRSLVSVKIMDVAGDVGADAKPGIRRKTSTSRATSTWPNRHPVRGFGAEATPHMWGRCDSPFHRYGPPQAFLARLSASLFDTSPHTAPPNIESTTRMSGLYWCNAHSFWARVTPSM